MLLMIFAFAFSTAVQIAAQQQVIHAGKLIDGRDEQVREEVSIVIDGGKITAVEAGFVDASEDQELIDLSECTVLPGFMDMHTHLMMEHHKDIYSDKFFLNESDFALRSTVYAKRTLMAGFTTVRDLGDNGINSVSLRKAIDKGWIVGPRIFTAGKSLATTGGHADPTNGQRGKFREDAGPVLGVVNGTEDARKAVRQRYKDGADLIKLTATGGVLSLASRVKTHNSQWRNWKRS